MSAKRAATKASVAASIALAITRALAAEQIKTDISAYSCPLRFPRQLRHCSI